MAAKGASAAVRKVAERTSRMLVGAAGGIAGSLWRIKWFGGDKCDLVAIKVVSFSRKVVLGSPIESYKVIEKSR